MHFIDDIFIIDFMSLLYGPSIYYFSSILPFLLVIVTITFGRRARTAKPHQRSSAD
jgi:hypothetical protein